jgi:hypothetical protein
MDEQTKDKIFAGNQDIDYAVAVMGLLMDRRENILELLEMPQSGEDLIRIQGAFNEINYLIRRINSAQLALDAEQILEKEYPEEEEEENG